MLFFIVFYGLDWVATVPPTVALCREHYGDAGPIVFGWVFAAHQVGAAVAATAAGVIRDDIGTYTLAWSPARACSASSPPPRPSGCRAGRRPTATRANTPTRLVRAQTAMTGV